MHNYIVETDRLILRPLTAADAPAVFAWGSDPEVNRYMSYPLERSVADAEAWLHVVEKSGSKDGYDFGFVRREDGLLIGSGGVYPWSDGRTWTFGYNLRRDCWGQGLIPEAVKEIIRHAFADLGYQALWAAYYDGNRKSKRVMQKCGMTYRLSRIEAVEQLGETRLAHYFAVTRREWER